MPAVDPAAVRLAQEGDIPRLMEIRVSVAENRLSDPGSIAAADYRRFVEDRRCWAWEADGAVSGFAALDADAASVWALFVLPDAQGRGGGRALLERLLGEARRRGLAEIRLTTEAGSRAELFYRAAGWEAAGREAEGELHLRLRL